MDPKPYVKYQNASSSGSHDTVLTRFFYCCNGTKSKKGDNYAKLGLIEKINSVRL